MLSCQKRMVQGLSFELQEERKEMEAKKISYFIMLYEK